MGENPGTRQHVVKVMLAAKLQVAISKIMAKYEISKSAAVLLAVTQGCHIEQALSPADYEIFNGRYKRKLVDIVKAGRENSHIPKAELERQRREQCTGFISTNSGKRKD